MSAIDVHVVTVSDRCARGEAQDRSGPAISEILTAAGMSVSTTIVPDGNASVRAAILAAVDAGAQAVLTSGGTGVGPRDRTPEATAPLLDIDLPGIPEELRRRGAAKIATAVLSRGRAGVLHVSADSMTQVNGVIGVDGVTAADGADSPGSQTPGVATPCATRSVVVVNLPGSPGGARDGAHLMTELLPHLVDQLGGGDH